jgi:hypothetical protein
MSKKSIITSILMDNTKIPAIAAVHYGVGDVPKTSTGDDAGQHAVTSIKFARKCFGQGAVIDIPCYVIEFEDVDEKVILATNSIARWTIGNEEIDAVPPLAAE